MGAACEWELPDGSRIRAEEGSNGVESVWHGARLVSRLGAGGSAGGHTFVVRSGNGEAHATFDGAHWTLTLDAHLVTPIATPPPRTSLGGTARNVPWRFVVAIAVVMTSSTIAWQFGDRWMTALVRPRLHEATQAPPVFDETAPLPSYAGPLDGGPTAPALEASTPRKPLAGRLPPPTIWVVDAPASAQPAPPPTITPHAATETPPGLSDAERDRRMKAARAGTPW